MPINQDGVVWDLSLEKMLTREEITKAFAVIKKVSFDDYSIFAVAANTGLRISEVLHLKVEDIGQREIVITRRKKKVLKPGHLNINDDTKGLFLRIIGKRKAGWLWPGESRGCFRNRQRDGKVYQREQICSGGHLSKREVQRRWGSYVAMARLVKRGRGVHALRHYAITEFNKTYKDIRATQEFAGHSSVAITERYAHVTDMAEKIRGIKPVL